MKLSTRLLLPLLGAVTAVMLVYALWAVRQRVQTLTREAQNETRAYAVPFGLAIELAFRDPYRTDAQELIDRLSREPMVYGVLVYDIDGSTVLHSEPLRASDAAPSEWVERVLRTGEPAEFERTIEDVEVFSVLRPIRDVLGKVIGAFEVTQPLSSLQTEIVRTRQRFLLNTATLLIAVTAVILLLVRRLVAGPLSRLITGARALAEGEMGHRVQSDPPGTELAQLADEFNRMADRLQVAHGELVHEAEERLLLERRLRESEKLAAVGNIAAGLAHEVGAPLHVIRGRAELLLRRGDLNPAEHRNLTIILEQIARITQIVRNLLDFARRGEPRLETVDAGAVVLGVIEFLAEELDRAGVTLVREGTTSAWVRADPDLLHQVFMNLLVNAVQVLERTDGERRITLRIEEETTPDTVVRVEVLDSGPGIAPELLPLIFDPFVTTKASGEGTGLGLAVARTIVEDHGGTIEAFSPGGGGALFRITLPGAPAHLSVHA